MEKLGNNHIQLEPEQIPEPNSQVSTPRSQAESSVGPGDSFSSIGSDDRGKFTTVPNTPQKTLIVDLKEQIQSTSGLLEKFKGALSKYQDKLGVQRPFSRGDLGLSPEEVNQWNKEVAAKQKKAPVYSHTQWLEEKVSALKSKLAGSEQKQAVVEAAPEKFATTDIQIKFEAVQKEFSELDQQHQEAKQLKNGYQDQVERFQKAFNQYSEAGPLDKIFLRRNPHKLGLTREEVNGWKAEGSEGKEQHRNWLLNKKADAVKNMATQSGKMADLAFKREGAQQRLKELKVLNEAQVRIGSLELKEEQDLAPVSDLNELKTRQKNLQQRLNEVNKLQAEIEIHSSSTELVSMRYDFKQKAQQIEADLENAIGQIHAVKAILSLKEGIESLDPAEDNFDQRHENLSRVANDPTTEILAFQDSGFKKAVSRNSLRGLVWEAGEGGTGAYFTEGDLFKSVKLTNEAEMKKVLATKKEQRSIIQGNRDKVIKYFEEQKNEMESQYKPWRKDSEMAAIMSGATRIIETIVRDHIDAKKQPKGLEKDWEKSQTGVAEVIRSHLKALNAELLKEMSNAQERAFKAEYEKQLEAIDIESGINPETTFKALSEFNQKMSLDSAISDIRKAEISKKLEDYAAAKEIFDTISKGQKIILSQKQHALEIAARMLANRNSVNINFRTEVLLTRLGLNEQTDRKGNFRTIDMANFGNKEYISAQDQALLQSERPTKLWSVGSSQKVFLAAFLKERQAKLQETDRSEPVTNDIRQRLIEESKYDFESLNSGEEYRIEERATISPPVVDLSRFQAMGRPVTREQIDSKLVELATKIKDGKVKIGEMPQLTPEELESLGHSLAIQTEGKTSTNQLIQKLGFETNFTSNWDLEAGPFSTPTVQLNKSDIALLIAFSQQRLRMLDATDSVSRKKCKGDLDELENLLERLEKKESEPKVITETSPAVVPVVIPIATTPEPKKPVVPVKIRIKKGANPDSAANTPQLGAQKKVRIRV